MRRIIYWASVALVLGGCAGFNRNCTSWQASSFGTDWIAVQYRADGTPINCWKLSNTNVDNEGHSDGIYWQDSKTRHLVHIAGWYNRVQVDGGRFGEAAKLLGIDEARCGNGVYR